MAQSYIQIQKQIADLQRKAEQVREREVNGVVERIKVAIAHYQLTPADLFGKAPAKVRAVKGRKSSRVAAAYSDGNGNTWGGRGPRPLWLRTALDQGKKLEDFAATSAPAASAAPAVRAAAKKRKAKVSYRGPEGQAWSGMGPKPRWLKEAIASGKSLEEFAAT